MKVYRRPHGPLYDFEVEIVQQWDLQSFSAWQDFLKATDAPVLSIAEYHLENTLDHFLAHIGGTLIGTLQIVQDTNQRHHLHRLIVAPEWRNAGAATELVRWADFFYDDVELWAYASDTNPLASLLDLFLFTEVTDAPEPETFELGGDPDQLSERDKRPGGEAGGGGGEPVPLDGPDAPTQDNGSPEPDEVRSDNSINQQPQGRPRKRGSRGGRKRKHNK